MAKLVLDEATVMMRPWQAWLRTVLIGLVIGFIYWAITMMLARYVIEPLACRDLVDAARCANAVGLGGNISAVLTALIGVLIMVRLGVIRPVIVAVGTGALLWSLGAWTNGLWWLEAMAWSILLHALSYGLFAWLTRLQRAIPAIGVGILLVVIIQIALSLT
jgi:hypothetical protein